MAAAAETLARIDAELAQFVTWDGRSADAASSSATDLDDEHGPCTECGYEAGGCEGLDHDAWSAEHTRCKPQDYEPGPEPYPTGEHLIARAGPRSTIPMLMSAA